MTDAKDDPREVLALLNSLGFVGITAPQLKAFMKDLKMYRKVKEREREQWKEDTRKKILSKQEQMLSEIYRDEIDARRRNLPELEKSSHREDSLVRIKIHCVTDDEDAENNDKENDARCDNRAVVALNDKMGAKILRSCQKKNKENMVNEISGEPTTTRRGNERSESHERHEKNAQISTNNKNATSERKNLTTQKVTQKEVPTNRESRDPARSLSAPNFTDQPIIPHPRSKSVASDPTGLANPRNNPSRCSSRSNTKSFIRPWRLQPEAQRAASARKSDPVALYQKYQQEWKQISFPGEDQHARVRWAVREKMLGIDPNPRPILKKSQSLMSVKKR